MLLAGISICVGQALPTQTGNASYYHDRFHGRKMANGKIYHRDSMTCAHLRYPLGTWLHVRNLSNGKEVIVQVTDRGPYSRKFVIDLSRAAARELGIIQYGFRPVEITPFNPARVPYQIEPSPERPEWGLGFGRMTPFVLLSNVTRCCCTASNKSISPLRSTNIADSTNSSGDRKRHKATNEQK